VGVGDRLGVGGVTGVVAGEAVLVADGSVDGVGVAVTSGAIVAVRVGVRVAVGVAGISGKRAGQNPPASTYGPPDRVPASGCPMVPPRR